MNEVIGAIEREKDERDLKGASEDYVDRVLCLEFLESFKFFRVLALYLPPDALACCHVAHRCTPSG